MRVHSKLSQRLLKTFVLLLIGLLTCTTADAAVRDSESKNEFKALRQRGCSLNAEQLLALEQKVAQQTNDVDGRIMLIAHYINISGAARHKSVSEHLLWMMEHAPKTSALARWGSFEIRGKDRVHHKDHDIRGTQIWQTHLREHPQDLTILNHAAMFFANRDSKLSISLLEKGYSREELNPYWSKTLGDLCYQLLVPGMTSEQRLPFVQKSLKYSDIYYNTLGDKLDDLDLRWRLARLGLEAGELDKAELYGKKVLSSAERHAVVNLNKYYAHLLLGQVAMKRNDIAQAKEHLAQAGDTGSFMMRNMSLAQMLLDKGETEAVLEYLQMAKAAGPNNQWQEQIEEWTSAIEANEQLNFDAKYLPLPDNLMYVLFRC